MNSITIPSKVLNGTLVNNKGKINNAIKHFEGKEIEIVVKQRKKLRSHPQNSYYFGVIIPLTINAVSDEWGEMWDAHKTHDFYKTMFLYDEVTHYDTGEVIKIPKSSTDNSTIEQEKYHVKCIEFLKEWFNVYVPLPNEHLKIS
jgi:hypothetical protein